MENENGLFGKMIPGVRLGDEKLINEAFRRAYEMFAEAPRFTTCLFSNESTHWTADLVLFAGYDESGNPQLPGYTKETGVMVGGVNVTPHSEQTTPVQPHVNCQATRVKCSAKCRRSDGLEQTINFEDQVAEAGRYWVKARFGFQEGQGHNVWDAKLELMDNTGYTHNMKMRNEKVDAR